MSLNGGPSILPKKTRMMGPSNELRLLVKLLNRPLADFPLPAKFHRTSKKIGSGPSKFTITFADGEKTELSSKSFADAAAKLRWRLEWGLTRLIAPKDESLPPPPPSWNLRWQPPNPPSKVLQ